MEHTVEVYRAAPTKPLRRQRIKFAGLGWADVSGLQLGYAMGEEGVRVYNSVVLRVPAQGSKCNRAPGLWGVNKEHEKLTNTWFAYD